MTNRQNLEKRGMMDDETIEELSGVEKCNLCMEEYGHFLSPTNPVCEGNWCDEAIQMWLDAEYEEIDP